jgi:hypothetical protein
MTRAKLVTLVATIFLVASASADTLSLRTGQTVEGVLVSADSYQVTFQGLGGPAVSYPLSGVAGVTFAAPPPPQPYIAAAPQPTTATLFAGSIISVRMVTSLSTESNHTGDLFTATLDSNLAAGNIIVARRGATVHGVVTKCDNARRLVGRSELQVELTDIVINGTAVPISTNGFQQAGSSEGANTARKTAGGAGLGAIIGSFSGNAGKGAAIGAASGLGVSMIRKGQPIRFPAETLLQFSLSQPTVVPVQR